MGLGTQSPSGRSRNAAHRPRPRPYGGGASGASGEGLCPGLSAPDRALMMKGRFVRESESDYSELALPNDANGFGNLLGGKIMHLVDLAGAIAAMKHCRNPVVTASVDHMDFIHPVKMGQLVRLRASVNRVFRSPME